MNHPSISEDRFLLPMPLLEAVQTSYSIDSLEFFVLTPIVARIFRTEVRAVRSVVRIAGAFTAAVGLAAETGCSSLTHKRDPLPAAITEKPLRSGTYAPMGPEVGRMGDFGSLGVPTKQATKTQFLNKANELDLCRKGSTPSWLAEAPLEVLDIEQFIIRHSNPDGSMKPLGSVRCAVLVHGPKDYENPNTNLEKRVSIGMLGLPFSGMLGDIDYFLQYTRLRGTTLFIINDQPSRLCDLTTQARPIRTVLNGVTKAGLSQMDRRLGCESATDDLKEFLFYFDKCGIVVDVDSHSQGCSSASAATAGYSDFARRKRGRASPLDATLPMIGEFVYHGSATELSTDKLGRRFVSFMNEGDWVAPLAEAARRTKQTVLPLHGEGLGYPARPNSVNWQAMNRESRSTMRVTTLREGVCIVAPGKPTHFMSDYAGREDQFRINAWFLHSQMEFNDRGRLNSWTPEEGARFAAKQYIEMVRQGRISPAILERAMTNLFDSAAENLSVVRAFADECHSRAPGGRIGLYRITSENQQLVDAFRSGRTR